METDNGLDEAFASFGNSFPDYKTAKKILLAKKDSDLKKFENVLSYYNFHFQKIKSHYKFILELEDLYYRIYVDKKLKEIIAQEVFEKYLNLIFMKILVENNLCDWKIVKNPFSQNNYNLAIEFEEDNWTTGSFAIELYENESNYGRKYLESRLKEYLN